MDLETKHRDYAPVVSAYFWHFKFVNLCSVCMQSPLLTTSAHRHVRFEIIIITIVGRWKKCKEKGELFAALGLVGENKNCAYNTGK